MTSLDLRTLRLAPGDYRREQVTATIAPFTAGAQEYHAEPADVQARLGLTRLPGGLLFDLALRRRRSSARASAASSRRTPTSR